MAQINRLERLSLQGYIKHLPAYQSLADGMIRLPVPEFIKIRGKRYYVPQTYDEFAGSICYGQRLFLARKEENDIGAIIRILDGYYYPLVTGKKWDDDKALMFGKYILHCPVFQLYPVSNHLVSLTEKMIAREFEVLSHEPTPIERAAGIEKLTPFNELSVLNFLRITMNVPVSEVLLTPYNECLVQLMLEKEVNDFRKRYIELSNEEMKARNKIRK